MHALCVCGLAAETRIAQAGGFAAVIGAGDTVRAAGAMAKADFLVSFGIAGGLSPDARPGTVILADAVVTDDGVIEARPDLRRAVADWAAALGAIPGRVLGSTAILATAEQKARAWHRSGALAVDLESGPVAQAAVSLGVPFVVLRAVADPAWRNLPPVALLPLVEGKPDLPRVLGSVMRQPWQVPGLVGLALETRQALRALVAPVRGLRRLIGP